MMAGSSLKGDADDLARREYWDQRYANHDSHEWFQSFSALAPFLQRHLFDRYDKGSRILHLGCGDSTVPLEIAQRGFTDQVCVDFSMVVIEQMTRREPSIHWIEADVRDMHMILDSSVDVAFDKGTMDAMIHGSPWDPPKDVLENTLAYVNEVYRVLRRDGVFLYITYRQPHFIKPVINRDRQWDCRVEVLQSGESAFDYYAFVLRKAGCVPRT